MQIQILNPETLLTHFLKCFKWLIQKQHDPDICMSTVGMLLPFLMQKSTLGWERKHIYSSLEELEIE